MITLDKLDKNILKLAQGNLTVSEEPFAPWADEVGISQDELIGRLKRMKEAGVIRDFKAILRHVNAGVSANAMVTWAVEEARVAEAGEMLAGFDAITHCYERPDFGRYNIFTMIHARTKEDLLNMIKDVSVKTGLSDYQIFWSKHEFKKTSMHYF